MLDGIEVSYVMLLLSTNMAKSSDNTKKNYAASFDYNYFKLYMKLLQSHCILSLELYIRIYK